MRDEYDFSQSTGNPYTGKLKKRQITINLDIHAIDYFKELSEKSGIPYQTLINFYLRDCAHQKRHLQVQWSE